MYGKISKWFFLRPGNGLRWFIGLPTFFKRTLNFGESKPPCHHRQFGCRRFGIRLGQSGEGRKGTGYLRQKVRRIKNSRVLNGGEMDLTKHAERWESNIPPMKKGEPDWAKMADLAKVSKPKKQSKKNAQASGRPAFLTGPCPKDI
jgi:hypothetical protein